MEFQRQPACFREISTCGKSFSQVRGRSGTSYVFSIYKPETAPAYRHAVYVVVKNRGGVTAPLMVGATTSLPALFFHGQRYNAALRRGGNQIHVHVPAPDICPKAVARDLSMVLSVADAELERAGADSVRTENALATRFDEVGEVTSSDTSGVWL